MSSNWRILGDRSAGRALLAVDFGPGRPEAGFADLVGNMSPATVVMMPVFEPVGDDPAGATDPVLRVRRWMTEIRERSLSVQGVLGYCAGGALACLAADLIREAGCGDPHVVLLDPNWVTGRGMQSLFVSSVSTYAQLLPQDRCQAALDVAGRVCATLGDDLTAVSSDAVFDAMRRLQEEYDGLVRLTCDQMGADDEIGREFSDRFSGFLNYLVTAGRVDRDVVSRRRDDAELTVFVSMDHQLDAEFGAPAERFAVSRNDLLADPALAKAVAASFD
ncbi:MAG TPA: hypothetical protein VF174_11775 [Micromonosporaceae bacterium]